MIPKIIHYCWFGTKPIPEDYQGYIAGWKKLMPDYEIIFWNESNSPMHLPYLQASLGYEKWANLANFVRIYALYHHGGIYMDTDMEVLKSLEPFRKHGIFLGFELGEKEGQDLVINNAIFGAEKGHPFIKKCMDFYLNSFDGRDSALDSSPYLVTRLLKEEGLQNYGQQNVEGVELFPLEYFYPYHITEQFTPECVKENTYTIHHWGYSWGKKPFSYRLEHLKKVSKEKLYQILPVHQKGYIKHGKLIGDILKGGTVKAGPFEGVNLPLEKDYERAKLPLLLAGIYKEELQLILYNLTNTAYQKIVYKGDQETYFIKGLQKLFPNTPVEQIDDEVSNLLSISGLKVKSLVITNSYLAKELVQNLFNLSKGNDYLLEFNYHLPAEEKQRIKALVGVDFDISFIPSQLNYQYEQNAFLQNYRLKEIEENLKKAVTDVHEWLVLKSK